MGYFANGTEGDIWRSRNCTGCVHNDPDKWCPVMSLHMSFNYEQHDKGMEPMRDALLELIPQTTDGYNAPCAMRHAPPASELPSSTEWCPGCRAEPLSLKDANRGRLCPTCEDARPLAEVA